MTTSTKTVAALIVELDGTTTARNVSDPPPTPRDVRRFPIGVRGCGWKAYETSLDPRPNATASTLAGFPLHGDVAFVGEHGDVPGRLLADAIRLKGTAK